MKITDILQPDLVVADLHTPNKAALLRELAQHLTQHGPPALGAADQVSSALLARERLGSTGVGEGVAIPHAKISGLDRLVACFGRVPEGVPFEAIDEQPVKLVFVLLVPENSAGVHLKALARISRLLKNAAFRELLLTLPDEMALYDAFLKEDSRH